MLGIKPFIDPWLSKAVKLLLDDPFPNFSVVNIMQTLVAFSEQCGREPGAQVEMGALLWRCH